MAHGQLIDRSLNQSDLLAQVGNIRGSCQAIANAGKVKDRSVDVLHTSIESFDRLMQVNLRGTFFLMQAFARRMAAEPPAQNYRALITISSSNASMAKTTAGEYCISKAGLSMVNRILALKLAPHGIGCFEVRPGLIKTEMNACHVRSDPDTRAIAHSTLGHRP